MRNPKSAARKRGGRLLGLHDVGPQGGFVRDILDAVPNPPSVGLGPSFGFTREGAAANGREAIAWATLATIGAAPGYAESFGPGVHQLPLRMQDVRAFLEAHDAADQVNALQGPESRHVTPDIALVMSTLTVLVYARRQHPTMWEKATPQAVIEHCCQVLRHETAEALRAGFTVH